MKFLALIFLAGCGFLGEPPYSGRRVPDVAPWQDLGPLLICDGPQALGTAAAAGFCGEPPSTACTLDRDCGSRERCQCGVCSVGYCDAAADCQAGFVCTLSTHRCDRSCMKDSDCKKNESCAEGRDICRGNCNSDGDCQSGESCNLANNTCQSIACAGDGDCAGHGCALRRAPSSLAEPTALAESGGVTLWLERDGQIVRATSRDGLAFQLDAAAPPLSGHAPSVVKTSSGYLMLFSDGTDVLRASSGDGVSWSVDAAAAILDATAPSLAQLIDGSFAAYVIAGGQVARSTSADGAQFVSPSPVLSPGALTDATLWRNLDAITSPFAQPLIDVDGAQLIRLWVAARGQESSPGVNFGAVQEVPANFSIGEAASPDGVQFTPYPFNPVFDRIENFLDHLSELEPAVLSLGDAQLLYYRRASADGTTDAGLAIARSPAQPR